MKLFFELAFCLIILRIFISIIIYHMPDPWHYYRSLFIALDIIDPKNGDWVKITVGPTLISHTNFRYIEFKISPSLSVDIFKKHSVPLSKMLNVCQLHIEEARNHHILFIYKPTRFRHF